MAFYGCEFTFDGKSCSEFGLMLYDIGSASQGDVSFPSAGKMMSDTTASRYSTFLYGVEQNEPLQFTLVFGAGMKSIDEGSFMDRFDIERIASWLTGHGKWKWLEIAQPDMDGFRYKCIISELKLITYGRDPWAFSCNVTCDSPFAYTYPKTIHYDVTGSADIKFFNRSSYNGYYKPKLVITHAGGGDVAITNHSDEDRVFLFENLPAASLSISIDNDRQLISETANGLDLYPYFNYKFLRLVRGDNSLSISGTCGIDFICEFPVNIGG